MAPHNLLGQIRPATVIHRAREHPALWRLIRCLATPLAQRFDQGIVSRNRFLRAFRFADANDVLHDRARNMNLFGLEVLSSAIIRYAVPTRKLRIASNRIHPCPLGPAARESPVSNRLVFSMGAATFDLSQCYTASPYIDFKVGQTFGERQPQIQG